MLFITNRFNRYFSVDYPLNTNLLKGCRIHESESEMFNFVSKQTGLPIVEITFNEINIKSNGSIMSLFCVKDDTQSFEDLISNFDL